MRSALIGVLTLGIGAQLAAQQPPPRPDWNIVVGAAALVVPEYPGSDEYRVLPIPMVQVAYRDRLFIGPRAGGAGLGLLAYSVGTPRLSVAAEAGLLDSRPEDRADALAGMEDRDVVGTVGASLTYRLKAVQADLSVVRGLNDEAGFLGTTSLSYTHMFARRVIATTGVNAMFADARQMRRDFGVTDAEATRRQALIDSGSDLLEPDEGNAYRPGGGLRQLGATLSLVYVVSPRWSIISFGGVNRLSDEAADSPFVRRREQFLGSVGVGLRL